MDLEERLLAAQREIRALKDGAGKGLTAAAAGEARAAEAAARNALAKRDRDLSAALEHVAELEANEAQLHVRIKDLAQRRRSTSDHADAASKTDRSIPVETAEAGVQCGASERQLVAAGAAPKAVESPSSLSPRQGARAPLDADIALLRDPPSTRVAAAAEAARAALPPAEAAALTALSSAQARMLPRLHALAGDAGAVAESQVSLLASIHALLSRLEAERLNAAAAHVERAVLRRASGGSTAPPPEPEPASPPSPRQGGMPGHSAVTKRAARSVQGESAVDSVLMGVAGMTEVANPDPSRSRPASRRVSHDAGAPPSAAEQGVPFSSASVWQHAAMAAPMNGGASDTVATSRASLPVFFATPPASGPATPRTPEPIRRGWLRGLFGSRQRSSPPSVVPAAKG